MSELSAAEAQSSRTTMRRDGGSPRGRGRSNSTKTPPQETRGRRGGVVIREDLVRNLDDPRRQARTEENQKRSAAGSLRFAKNFRSRRNDRGAYKALVARSGFRRSTFRRFRLLGFEQAEERSMNPKRLTRRG